MLVSLGRRGRPGPWLGFLCLCFVACGCGRSTYPVSGKVVYADGEPVSAGIIEFMPTAGGTVARASLDAEGRFDLSTGKQPGAPPGTYRIAVIQVGSADGYPGHVRPHHRAGRLVHPRHRQFETSQLERVVEAGNNVFSIEVESSR